MIEEILNVLHEERLDEDKHLRTVGEFESLEEGLTNYLHGESFEYNRIGKGNTYLILHDNIIVAYYTLKANAVELYDEESDKIESIPCVEIAKFSIAKEFKGKDFGTLIFNYFIKPKIYHIREMLAIEQIILFSVSRKKVIKFYKDLGFDFQIGNKIEKYIKETDNEDCKFMYMYCN